MKKSPNVAVVTNIMNDHMDKYRSMREYVADKENIFRFQKKGDVAVLNYDNYYTRKMCRTKLSFGWGKAKLCTPVWFSLKKHIPRWVPLEKILLPGEHNYANALAAAAAAEAAGVSRVHIIEVLKAFRGLPGRLEFVREVDGVRYYSDTTATTPEATIAGLKMLAVKSHNAPRPPLNLRGGGDTRIILIAGGADKKLEFRELAKYVKQYCKAVVLLPGTATKKIELRIKNEELRIVEVKNMVNAVKKAHTLAQDGDIILLSPAAASFGLFLNEFDRGRQFVAAVKKL